MLLTLFPLIPLAHAADPASRHLTRQPPGTAAALHAEVPATAKGTLYALVVGVNDFQDPAIPDLSYAERDARLFAETLRDRALQPPARQRIELLAGRDATRAAIRDGYEQRLAQAGPDDIVVLYVSSHGDVAGGEGYLVAQDTKYANDLENLRFSGLALRDLDAAVERSNAGLVLVVLDACHSGLAGGASDEPFNPGKGRRTGGKAGGVMFLSASLAGQLALEGPEWCPEDGGGHGAFTCVLSHALRGEADVDESGLVTLSELAAGVPARVLELTTGQQIASYSLPSDGSLAVARTDWDFVATLHRAPTTIRTERSRGSWALLAGAGGALALAGAAGVAAWATDAAFPDAADRAAADRLVTMNHAALVGAGVLGAGAAGLTLVAGVKGEW